MRRVSALAVVLLLMNLPAACLAAAVPDDRDSSAPPAPRWLPQFLPKNHPRDAFRLAWA